MMKRKDPAAEREERAAPVQKPGDWDERLRLVGDARFVDVAWSARDRPSWPLPTSR